MTDVQTPSDSHVRLSDRVAEELRALLARRRLSGRDLAKRLTVSPSWVSYRLTGTTEIGLNDLERIAGALGVEVSDLLPATQRDQGANYRSLSTPVNPSPPRSPDRVIGRSRPQLVNTPTLTPIPGHTIGHSEDDPDTRRPVIRTTHTRDSRA